jgi:hypothetical protein
MSRRLTPRFYLQILCATLAPRRAKRKPLAPGPTVSAYRQSLGGGYSEKD